MAYPIISAPAYRVNVHTKMLLLRQKKKLLILDEVSTKRTPKMLAEQNQRGGVARINPLGS